MMDGPMPGAGGDMGGSSPFGQVPNTEGLLTVINGMFVGVGGVYTVTGSVPVAGIAGATSVLSAWFVARRTATSTPATAGADDSDVTG